MQHYLYVYSYQRKVPCQIFHFSIDELFSLAAMRLQILQSAQKNVPELVTLHKLHQGPEGFFSILDVKEQGSGNIVQSLNVA